MPRPLEKNLTVKIATAIALAVGISSIASAQPLNTGAWIRVGAANVESPQNKLTGGMFNGNCNLSSACTYGADSNGDFWNAFNPTGDTKILFITRDRQVWAEALWSTVNALTTASAGVFTPNIQWINAGRNGVDLGSGIVGNILMRCVPCNKGDSYEDPWVTLQGPHDYTDSREILWGEDNYNKSAIGTHHYDLMFDHGGLDVFITTTPEPRSAALLGAGLLAIIWLRRRAQIR